MSISIIIIILTVIITIAAFNNVELMNKLILYPAIMKKPAELYRLLTSGFIHADWNHLIFNMIALFFLGRWVEQYYAMIGKPTLFVWMYLSAVALSSLPALIKHRDNYYYRALGASGGVSAVLFSFVYLAPWQTIYVWFIPVPGIILAIGYLIYSAVMSKKGVDNVGHDAHFYGAVYGFAFTWIFDPTHGQIFLQQITNPSFNF